MTTGSTNLIPASPARRSCLSVPASSPGMLAKASTLDPDEVVIDLEDSVAIDAKDTARAAAVAALRDWDGATVSVRVNAPRSRWCHLDLLALAETGPQLCTVVIPKVESAGDVAFVDRLLEGLEAVAGRDRPIGIQALIETPTGLTNVDEIARGSGRLQALILGYADLAWSLGRPAAAVAALDLWLPTQESVLIAARHHGLQAIDGPFLGTAPDAVFMTAARRARDLGFDGKWAIHPSQIPALDELFSPTREEIAHARAVVAALARAERSSNGNDGAVALDGQMLDEAVRRMAMRVLARAPGSGVKR